MCQLLLQALIIQPQLESGKQRLKAEVLRWRYGMVYMYRGRNKYFQKHQKELHRKVFIFSAISGSGWLKFPQFKRRIWILSITSLSWSPLMHQDLHGNDLFISRIFTITGYIYYSFLFLRWRMKSSKRIKWTCQGCTASPGRVRLEIISIQFQRLGPFANHKVF